MPRGRREQLAELGPAFRWSEARDAGITQPRLTRLMRDGAIERVARGLYLRADATPVDLDLLEIANASNRATLCLATALAHHDLIDEIPSTIHVALPRNVNRPRVSAPVSWHRFDVETFDLHRRDFAVVPGFALGVYGPERSIVDAYRLHHLHGDEMGREALRVWLRQPGNTPSDLLTIAGRFPKARPRLQRDLEILL